MKRDTRGRFIKTTKQRPVHAELLITRASGDTERYPLTQLPDMRYAIKYRQAVQRVRVPAKA